MKAAKSQESVQGLNVARRNRGIPDSTCRSPACINVYVYTEKTAVQKMAMHLSRCISSRKGNIGRMHSIACTRNSIFSRGSSLCMRDKGKRRRSIRRATAWLPVNARCFT